MRKPTTINDYDGAISRDLQTRAPVVAGEGSIYMGLPSSASVAGTQVSSASVAETVLAALREHVPALVKEAMAADRLANPGGGGGKSGGGGKAKAFCPFCKRKDICWGSCKESKAAIKLLHGDDDGGGSSAAAGN